MSENPISKSKIYDHIFQSSLEIVALISFRGKVIDVSETAVKKFGYSSRSEMVGVNLLKLLKSGEAALPKERIQKLLHGEKLEGIEREFKNKKGEVWVGLANAIPILDDLGTPIEILVIVRDITEIKNNERRLRDSKNLYQTIFENVPIGIGLADLRGNLVDFNPEMLRPGGYSKKDIEKIKNVSKLYYDKKERTRILTLANKQGYVDDVEVEFVKKDGTPYPTLMSLRQVKLDRKIHWLALVLDLSKQKEAENKLASEHQISEERGEKHNMFQLAVENAAEHIIVTDPDAKIIYANPAASKITGYSIDEMMGKTPALWGNHMPKEFYEKMWDTIKNKKQTFVGEVNNKKKDGTLYISSLYITPILDDKKNVKYFIGIERDVTKEKQIEQMKDDFVNIAAHDLRTPATAVKGFLSMVLEGDAGTVGDSVKEMIKDAYEGNERLIELINNFLNVSRIERGKITVNPKPGNITHIVKAAIQNLKHAAEDKGLYLKYEPQANLPKVMADEDRTIEVISNLVGNALKFTEKGGITISHEIKGHVLVTNISDTGPGISKDLIPELFQKFRRAGTRANTPGLGLGLYISKLIIMQSHGEIWVKSEEGKGSTFSFSLPIVK